MDTDYAYLHNLLGDVMGILDMNGASVVDDTYEACRIPTYTESSMAETLGADNPFRCRGVVWDGEPGLYDLRSRYYNPARGRFMNADTFWGKTGALFCQNVFTYCLNSPSNKRAPYGYFHGELFSIEKDAVIDFADYYNQASIALNYEFASFTRVENGKYAYHFPYTDQSPDAVNMSWMHEQINLQNALGKSLNSYLITPDGHIQRMSSDFELSTLPYIT